MKIAIFSDLHLGFGSESRGGESFDNAENAFALALSENPDAILIAGDLFDSAVPKQEVLVRAFGVFAYAAKKLQGSGLNITREGRKGNTENLTLPPIIAIHGTHEFRGKDYANVIQLLEKAGFLIYLHAQKIKLTLPDKNETLVVQGMGGVPESKALDALNALGPKPVPGVSNIFLLHQSIKEFLPIDDEMVATISIPNLPLGFDFVVNGHLHWHSEEKLNGGGKLLMPGSTIITQMKKLESTKEKGIFIFDTKTETKSMCFIPLPSQRKFFYHKVAFEGADPDSAAEEITALVEEGIAKAGNSSIPPLIRLKLTGTLAKGVSPSDVPLHKIEEKYRNRAILSISREFSTQEFRRKIAELRELQNSKKSVISMGMDLLERNLEEAKFSKAFDARRVFGLLAEGETEKVIGILQERKQE